MFDREVSVPDLGPDAYVIFGISEMDRFEEAYGEMYLQRIVSGIDASALSIFRNCIEVMVKDSKMSVDDILAAYPFASVAAWLLKAISVSLHGRAE